MSYSFDAEKKHVSAAETSRRERAERAEKRARTAAQAVIRRAYQRHAALKRASEELRATFDGVFATAVCPTPEAAKKLRLAAHDLPLPPHRTTHHLVRCLLFFYLRKLPQGKKDAPAREADRQADVKRLVNLCCLVSAAVLRTEPSVNYALFSCDAKHAQAWTQRTKAFIALVVEAMGDNIKGGTGGERPLNRLEYGATSKVLMDLTDAKKWGFTKLQARGGGEGGNAAQMQAVMQTVAAAAAQRCGELLRCLAYDAAFPEVAAGFFARHVTPVERRGAEKQEDVMATATLRICLSIAVLDDAARRLVARSIIRVPHVTLRMPVKIIHLLTEPEGLWSAAIDLCLQQTPAGKDAADPWPARHIFANVTEIGCRFVMGAKHHERWSRWLDAMRHLIDASPAWHVIKRTLEAEPLLDQQLSLLWSPGVVSGLFGKLLDDDSTAVAGKSGSKGAAGIVEAGAAVKKKKGFLARLREKASCANDAAKGQPGQGAAADDTASNPLLAAIQAGKLRDLRSLPAWCPPVWLPMCDLYLMLIAKWSSRTILSALAVRSFLLVALWRFLEANIVCVNMLAEGDCRLPPETADAVGKILLLFLSCYEHFLPVCDDNEFYTLQQPFSLQRVVVIVTLLAKLALRLAWNGCQDDYTRGALAAAAPRVALMQRLKAAARSLLLLLNDRNVRRQFARPETWMVRDFCKTLGFVFDPSKPLPKDKEARVATVVHDMPFTIPFADRALYLRGLIEKDREAVQMNDIKFGLNIRRDFIFEDAVDRLDELIKGGPAGAPVTSSSRLRLKARFHVVFKNAQGLEEAGIDAGGVFKEFIEAVAKKGFDPNLGLFKGTEDNKFYPNPESKRLYGPAHMRKLYEFMGWIVGKAVYEGVVLNVPFAEFFLNTMLGRANFVEDLRALDPSFHKNLLALKEMDDVENLCLTFSYEEESMGEVTSVNLIPHGADIDVTSDNVIHYISAMAHAKLNTQFRDQSAAFISGFYDIFPPRWVGLFNRNELQQLISGMSASFDINDLRAHTKYAGGYSDTHGVVKSFWKTLDEFDDAQKAAFLAFVTASSKPPLLGFAHLQPPFCIRCADDGKGASFFNDVDRLPSASTCFNLLKLPPYKSRKNMKEKLLYSIHSGAGFELS